MVNLTEEAQAVLQKVREVERVVVQMAEVPWVAQLAVQPVVQIVLMRVPRVVEKEERLLPVVKVVQEEMKRVKWVAQALPGLR